MTKNNMEFASIKQKQIAAAESKHNLDSTYIEGQLAELENVLEKLQDFSDSELVDASDAVECVQANISTLEEMLGDAEEIEDDDPMDASD